MLLLQAKLCERCKVRKNQRISRIYVVRLTRNYQATPYLRQQILTAGPSCSKNDACKGLFLSLTQLNAFAYVSLLLITYKCLHKTSVAQSKVRYSGKGKYNKYVINIYNVYKVYIYIYMIHIYYILLYYIYIILYLYYIYIILYCIILYCIILYFIIYYMILYI